MKRDVCGRMLALVIAVALFGTLPAHAQRRPITEKDLFKFVWVADPQISPDGSQVAFVRVTVDEKKDQYDTSIWIVEDRRQRAATRSSPAAPATPRRAGRPTARRLAFFRVRREGRPAAAAADLRDGHGRRRGACRHRDSARRGQSCVVA